MSDFKVKHASVTPAYAARLADELEAMIGEVMDGRRKADRLPVEHMFGLIQFVRATPAPTGPAPAVEGVDPATLPTPENTAQLLGLIAAVQGWADGKLVMGAAVEDLIAHIDAFGAQQREAGRLEERSIAFDPAAKCSPMLTQCPRCKNVTKHCDSDLAAPTAQEVTEPSRTKLRPMQNEEEQAAGIVRQWYFDCDGHYIDVALDDGKYSIFFRDRATKKGAWMDQSDEVVTPPTATAATDPQEFTSNPVDPQKGESLSDKVAPPAPQQAGIAAQGAQAEPSDAADAARYRWLRKPAQENLARPDAYSSYPTLPWVVRVELDPWPTTKPISGAILDEAIDMARAARPTNGGGK